MTVNLSGFKPQASFCRASTFNQPSRRPFHCNNPAEPPSPRLTSSWAAGATSPKRPVTRLLAAPESSRRTKGTLRRHRREDEVEDGRVKSKQATLTYVQRIYDTAQQPSRGVRYDGSGPRESSPGSVSGGSLYFPLQQARPQQRRPSATRGAVQPAPPLDGGRKPNSRSRSALSCAAGK